ncbi:MAG: thiolase domain-containing protein [Chloroflexi bacterium]|nr:thiolase domain-containing protein [Chloroflexota bacterium]
MRPVAVVGFGQIPVVKQQRATLRQMGATVVQEALTNAGADPGAVGALYASSMLADELQGQKQVAALIADEAGLAGVEALDVRAATAGGAAALRMAWLAVACGAVDLAVAVGVEKMSDGIPTPVLAKALDAQREVPDGATLISQNALLMALYRERYAVPADGLAHFAVNAHANARHNPNALFRNKAITPADVLASRLISPPIRLLDCSPICDGAAAVLLAPLDDSIRYTKAPVRILASSAASDRFRVADRLDPLALEAARRSAQAAYTQASLTPAEIDFYEVHDAFSIMACLLLEAAGFAAPGEGWCLAADGEIRPDGRIPLSTRGGLKARGHPIGATALYQACEIVQQLIGQAGGNQLDNPRVGMMQSVGGAGVTVLTHLFGVAAGG